VKETLEKIVESCQENEGNIISILQDIQDDFGYLPEDAINWVSERLDIPPAHFFGIATFYAQFHLKPRGENVITACCGTACHVKGVDRIISRLTRELELNEGEDTTEDGKFTLDKVACLGTCSFAPVVLVNGAVRGKARVERLVKEIRSLKKGEEE
jgi:NADH:ubiquinone oxidoreductase subunit E